MAQEASAPAWGAGGRPFKSGRPDQVGGFLAEKDWFNFPNFVTLARLFLVVTFFLFSLWGIDWVWVIFLLAALSDFLEGWLARTFNQMTSVGEAFDPFVDRLLVFSGIFSLYISGKVTLLPIVLIITRDVIIIGGYIFLSLKRVRMEVTYLGKIATFSIFFATLILLLGLGSEKIFWLAVFLYLASGGEYIYNGTRRFLVGVYGGVR